MLGLFEAGKGELAELALYLGFGALARVISEQTEFNGLAAVRLTRHQPLGTRILVLLVSSVLFYECAECIECVKVND